MPSLSVSRQVKTYATTGAQPGSSASLVLGCSLAGRDGTGCGTRSAGLAVAAEPGQAPPGGQERVLGNFLRIMVVVQDGERDMVGPDGVTAHELIEGPQVTLLGAPDQPWSAAAPTDPEPCSW